MCFHTVLQGGMVCNFKDRVPVMQMNSDLSYLLSLCLPFYMQYNTNLVNYLKQIHNLDAFYSLKSSVSDVKSDK